MPGVNSKPIDTELVWTKVDQSRTDEVVQARTADLGIDRRGRDRAAPKARQDPDLQHAAVRPVKRFPLVQTATAQSEVLQLLGACLAILDQCICYAS